MNHEKIINDILADLKSLSLNNPNERLPKEEQIRSRMYASLIGDHSYVSVERGYYPIEDGNSSECDLWLKNNDGSEAWVEIKRCWSGKGLIDKPKEQLESWTEDINKLSHLPTNTERYFILIGVFEHDPKIFPRKSKVLSNIDTFHTEHEILFSYKPMHWRNSSINFVCCWCFKWKYEEKI